MCVDERARIEREVEMECNRRLMATASLLCNFTVILIVSLFFIARHTIK
jgi:hypothetical protein